MDYQAPDSLPATLAYMDRAREKVLLEINAMVPSDSARSGHLYELMMDYPLREGKGLRPSLCLAAARALGSFEQEIIKTAAVMELYHNAFLIHDDVEDASDLRRGAATLNRDHGDAMAINVGDGMLAVAMTPLLENTRVMPLGRALGVMRVVARMVQETAEGQALELGWIQRGEFQADPGLYYRIVYKKTSWYSFIAPLLAACVVTGRKDLQPAFWRFGTLLGAAFQIQDDVLNLKADEGAYGKEINGDLWEGKPTLMLLHALSHSSTDDRSSMLQCLARKRPSPATFQLQEQLDALSEAGHVDEVAKQVLLGETADTKTVADVMFLLERVQQCGSLDYAWREARRRATRAKRILEATDRELEPGVHRDFLHGIVDYVVDRER